MFISAALPGALYGALALTIPESPRYLVQKGQRDRAHHVLGQVLESGVDERIDEISRSVAARSATTPASPTCAVRRWASSRSCGSASCCRSSSRPSAST
jgi:hypothetical protein